MKPNSSLQTPDDIISSDKPFMDFISPPEPEKNENSENLKSREIGYTYLVACVEVVKPLPMPKNNIWARELKKQNKVKRKSSGLNLSNLSRNISVNIGRKIISYVPRPTNNENDGKVNIHFLLVKFEVHFAHQLYKRAKNNSD